MVTYFWRNHQSIVLNTCNSGDRLLWTAQAQKHWCGQLEHLQYSFDSPVKGLKKTSSTLCLWVIIDSRCVLSLPPTTFSRIFKLSLPHLHSSLHWTISSVEWENTTPEHDLSSTAEVINSSPQKMNLVFTSVDHNSLKLNELLYIYWHQNINTQPITNYYNLSRDSN